LEAEVEEYDKFIRGEYVVLDVVDEDDNVVESCGGYDDMDYAISEGKSMVDAILRLKAEELSKAEQSIVGS